MRICVVGTGYVGLVVATCLAEGGNDVHAMDKDGEKVAMLQDGKLPIYEPGLRDLVTRNLSEGRLSFTTDLDEAIESALITFICVDTPPLPEGGVDLSRVEAVATAVADALSGTSDYRIIVNKSTVPVGTADVVRSILKERLECPFDVVSNPEFLKEGAAVDDFMKPDRVVVGTESPQAAAIMKELYAPFVRTGRPILVMDNRSAELTKYASNALLATRISFINEIANLAERLGADISKVREGMATDQRIGFSFLFPGVGYGGSCFPKDLKALRSFSDEAGYEFRILDAVETVNEKQKRLLFEKCLDHFDGSLEGKRIAIWGLSFKPRTNDMREAPSITIVRNLLEAGARVQAFDPEAIETARGIFGHDVNYGKNMYAALEDAQALCLVTEWNEFRRPNFERMKDLMAEPIIFDGRNIYDPDRMRELGFVYEGIGTKPEPSREAAVQ